MNAFTRTLAAVLAALCLAALASCENHVPPEAPVVRVAAMKGPTGMGLAKLMSDEQGGGRYEFSIAGSADEITPRLARGELDIAAVPSNLAAVLYHNTNGEIQLLAVNTFSVIYVVERGESIASVADLRGKTVYATGKGQVPEYAFRHILEKNGMDPDADLTIEWKSQPDEVVALLASGGGIAVLPQPYVTAASGKIKDLRVAVDLGEAWKAVEPDSEICIGTLVVRRAFAEAHPALVASFLKEYEASVAFVCGDPAAAAPLIESCGIAAAAVAEKAIPYCHIVCLTGDAMRPVAEGFYRVLLEQNPTAVGGSLPGEDFYVKPSKP